MSALLLSAKYTEVCRELAVGTKVGDKAMFTGKLEAKGENSKDSQSSHWVDSAADISKLRLVGKVCSPNPSNVELVLEKDCQVSVRCMLSA